jgi:hypothetical protein
MLFSLAVAEARTTIVDITNPMIAIAASTTNDWSFLFFCANVIQ